MPAKVTKAFPGRPDNEDKVREIAVGEVIYGDLAAVALREKWAVEAKDKGHETNADGLDNLKLDELKALADSESIDLGSAAKKDDILAVIRAARASV